MESYTRLFSGIIQSTIWGEPHHVRIVWVTMLALADRDGVVHSSVPGLAHAARVTLDECSDAMKRLLSPDEWSRSPEEGGRRVVEVPGGWLLVNHAKYRDLGIPSKPHLRGDRRGYVYYAGVDERVKIGFSTNPWARIKEMKTAIPNLALLAVERGPLSLEGERQTQFDEFHVEHEWFAHVGRLANHIRQISARQPGQRSAVAATPSADRSAGATVPSASASASAKKKSKRARPDPIGFAEWYDAYPRHTNRSAASKVYLKAIGKLGDSAGPKVLLDAAVAFTAYCRRTAIPLDKTPHPSTWLNQERWENDYAEQAEAELRSSTETRHEREPDHRADKAAREHDEPDRTLPTL